MTNYMPNELFGNFLLFLIPAIFIGVTLVIILVKREYKKTIRVLEGQAIKRNGRVVSVFLAYPKLIFNYHANEITVYFTAGSKYSPPHTHFNLTFNILSNQKMFIFKEGTLSKIGKMFGLQDIQIDYDSFDKEVIIRGTDEYFIKSILTIDIQDKILSIDKKLNLYIKLDETGLELTVADIIRDDQTFDKFIDLGLALFDKIREKSGSY